jgi:hypothetical protein
MSIEPQNAPKSGDEEVDIIRLFNYFKQGFVSFFKKIGSLFGYLIQLIILLKKNWILVGGLIVLGALFGAVIKPLIDGSVIKYYEMTVRSGPTSNLELYAFANEVKSQKASSANPKSEGIFLAKELGIIGLIVEPVKRDEDAVTHYFEQIESNKLRGIDTDTLYFKDFKLKEHKAKMVDTDYPIQRIKIKAKENSNMPNTIQERLIGYLNNLPGVKADQEVRKLALDTYEKGVIRSIDNIDSIMAARKYINRQEVAAGGSQMVFNTANRENVERDMLRSYEIFSKKLYGIQKEKALYPNPVNIVANLRSAKEENLIINPTVHFALLGFLLSVFIVLAIRFNKYLDRYEKENT